MVFNHKPSHSKRNPGKAAARLPPGGFFSLLADLVWTAPNAAEPSCDCVLGSDRNQVSVSAECKLTICEIQQGHQQQQETDSHDCSTYLQTRRRNEPVGSFIAKSEQVPAHRRIVNMRLKIQISVKITQILLCSLRSWRQLEDHSEITGFSSSIVFLPNSCFKLVRSVFCLSVTRLFSDLQRGASVSGCWGCIWRSGLTCYDFPQGAQLSTVNYWLNS